MVKNGGKLGGNGPLFGRVDNVQTCSAEKMQKNGELILTSRQGFAIIKSAFQRQQVGPGPVNPAEDCRSLLD